MAAPAHHVVAETVEGHIVLGYVTISRFDSTSFNIVGSGDFTTF